MKKYIVERLTKSGKLARLGFTHIVSNIIDERIECACASFKQACQICNLLNHGRKNFDKKFLNKQSICLQ